MADAPKTPEQTKKEAEQREADRKRREEAEKKESGHSPHTQQNRSAGGSSGKVSTYSATVSGAPMEDPRGPDRILTAEQIHAVAGDLLPGELAFVKLSEEGTPEGAAFRDIPDSNEIVARVYASPKAAFDDVVTPSGAPLTKFMNPDPQLWDEGMRLRNPIPKEDARSAKYGVPPGGGVVNQPVTT